MPKPNMPADPAASTSPFAEPSTQIASVEEAPSLAPVIDAGPVAVTPAGPIRGKPTNPGNPNPAALIDAGPTVEPAVEIMVNALPGSQWRFPNSAWQDIAGTSFKVPITEPTRIEVRNACCEDVPVFLDKSKPTISVKQQFKPATIHLKCAVKDALVAVEWKTAGKPRKSNPSPNGQVYVDFETDATSSTKSVSVSFTNGEKNDQREFTVQAGKPLEVVCKL
jgi:hypothetical protein